MPENLTKNQDALREWFLEQFPQLKEVQKDNKEKKDEEVAKMLEANTELKARVEKLEAQPVTKVSLEVPGEPTKADFLYKGYDIRKQGSKFSIVDNDEREAIAKIILDVVTKASMQEGTTTEGGYLVFDNYVNEILALARLQSVALRDCTIYPMASDVLHIPAENGGVSIAWKTEETAVAAGDPVVTEVALTAVKLGAYATASNELLEDSTFDIVSWLTELFAEAVGQEIDSQVFNGTTFTALIGASGINSVETSSDSTTTVDHSLLSRAIATLSSNKLMGAKFYFHRTIFHYVRTMEDGAGNALYTPAMGSAPGRLWEFPYELVESFPKGLASGRAIGMLGNLKHYVIGRRKGAVTLDIDPYGKFLEYQTRLRLVTRWHGLPAFAAAFCEMRI